MRRLFSTFPGGLPGAGLLVMRLGASLVLAARSITAMQGEPALVSAASPALQFALALQLLAGVWTPLAGLLVALIEVARLVGRTETPWVSLLLATLGLALALVGPGAWSIDARLFGWRRIHPRDRQSRTNTFKG